MGKRAAVVLDVKNAVVFQPDTACIELGATTTFVYEGYRIR